MHLHKNKQTNKTSKKPGSHCKSHPNSLFCFVSFFLFFLVMYINANI